MNKNRNSNKQIILHVGLPKTGTKFIQKMVFNHIENLYYSGQFSSNWLASDHEKYLKELIYINDKGVKYWDKEKIEKINNFLDSIKEKIVLISAEALSGSPWDLFCNQAENAYQLKKIFDSPRIFLVFRKQDDWIESYYNQTFVKKSFPISINKFINIKKLDLEPNYNWFTIYQNYKQIFGEKNILALPYELFRKEPENFLNAFYEFFDIPPYYPKNYQERINKSIHNNDNSKYSIIDEVAANAITSLINITPTKFLDFIRKKLRQHIIPISKKINLKKDFNEEKLTKKQREKILNLHKDSNLELSNSINLDLSKYNYY